MARTYSYGSNTALGEPSPDLEDLVRASHAPQQQQLVAQHLQRCDELLCTIQRAGTLNVNLLAPAQTATWRRLVDAEQVRLSTAATECCIGHADLLEGRDDVSQDEWDQQRPQSVQRGPGAKQGVAGLKERLLVSRLDLFLLDGIPAQQLLAAGYAVAPFWRELTIVRKLDCLVLDVEHHSEPLQQGALVLKLQQVGQRLRALSCSWACNNPACSSTSNFAGASELLAKRKYCSRCRTAAYCSQECLVAHFKQHKGDCKALASAAASAGEGVTRFEVVWRGCGRVVAVLQAASLYT